MISFVVGLISYLSVLIAGVAIGVVVYWYIDVQEHDRAALEDRFRKWFG